MEKNVLLGMPLLYSFGQPYFTKETHIIILLDVGKATTSIRVKEKKKHKEKNKLSKIGIEGNFSNQIKCICKNNLNTILKVFH